MRAPAWWTTRRRRRLADQASDPAVAAYLREPAPGDRTPLGELRLLAVDLETTGLDPRADQILSIGFVPVHGHRIDLAGAGQLLVRPESADGGTVGVGSSATIHGLTDDEVATGVLLPEAVAALLQRLAGRVLLAHHSPLEVGFLQAAARLVAGVTPPIPSVCTLRLERRSYQRRQLEPADGALRLAGARAGRGLPDAPLHAALSDALACAELYLAQTADLLADDPALALGAIRRH